MFELTRYRTFGARFWAALVDGIVFVPLGFVDELLQRAPRLRSNVGHERQLEAGEACRKLSARWKG